MDTARGNDFPAMHFPAMHCPAGTTRRDFFLRAGSGVGKVALAAMLLEELARDCLTTGGRALAAEGAAPHGPHFKPRARRVIHLFMHGGPSHVDLLDPKPALLKHAGQPAKALRWGGRTYDPADPSEAPPRGFRRVAFPDPGHPLGPDFCWFEKLNDPRSD